MAGALGIPLRKNDPMVQLGHAIAGRGRCLVVLDNFVRGRTANLARAMASGLVEVVERERFVQIGVNEHEIRILTRGIVSARLLNTDLRENQKAGQRFKYSSQARSYDVTVADYQHSDW